MAPFTSSDGVEPVARSLRLAWLAGRLLAPGLARRVVPGVLVAMVLLTWLWVALPLGALQRAASQAGALTSAAVAVALLSTYALVLGPRLGAPLLGARLAWLRRQPLGGAAWSLALAPWLLSLSIPASLPALLWPWPGSLLWLACWLALGCLLLLAASGGLRGALPGVGLAVMGWLLLLLAGAGASGLVAAGVLAALGVGLGVGPLYLWLASRPGGRAVYLPGRPRGPLAALLRRDLLALLRQAPGALVASVGTPLIPLALLWAFVAAGHLPVAGLRVAAELLLALGSPALLVALGRLVDLLGPGFDPRRWPVSPALRLVSLLLLVSGLHLPAAVLSVVLLGPMSAPGLLALSSALVAGSVLVATWTGGARARPANVGSYLAWAAVAVASARLLGPVALLVLAAGAAGLTLHRLSGLRRRKT